MSQNPGGKKTYTGKSGNEFPENGPVISSPGTPSSTNENDMSQLFVHQVGGL